MRSGIGEGVFVLGHGDALALLLALDDLEQALAVGAQHEAPERGALGMPPSITSNDLDLYEQLQVARKASSNT
jgi:hypothetical protein